MIRATIVLDGDRFEVALDEKDGAWHATVGDDSFQVARRGDVVDTDLGSHLIGHRLGTRIAIDGVEHDVRIETVAGVAGADVGGQGSHGPVFAPMTGKIEAIEVQEGDTVAAGDVLFVLEAMKMRNQVKAAADGVIGPVRVAAGANVDTKTQVLDLLPA